ncbi:L-aspartate oxidase [Salipaludibacillus agaradhaerens]|uniref:L-aspartate oxidase n=1 Tax=Salipaludibacillus agaradhaerens TaxID=76935 RepID=A0A9Q4B2B8_SALAG|nr:L-aspartate oxidase [Salipaludibacillus agaradhaerens]MCR6097041.1 L-aspartate oxidase [Salipaludibacillus agaradhaerens]MCR6113474.1 L-aspartate oxidase [Salipaludibacillus agaradhaerens]
MEQTDVLIIGGGLAGVMTALTIADSKKVTIVTKRSQKEGNSWKAQGGIAAALGDDDSPNRHIEDTRKAGCNKNDSEMVHILAHEGKSRLQKWMNEGLQFDVTEQGTLDLGREGAHSCRRIAHVGGDRTGKEMMRYFIDRLKGRVSFHTHWTVVQLIVEGEKCCGALFLNEKGKLTIVKATHTVLATGGIGGLFTHTSNDTHLCGDGLAVAARAGATLTDLEFIQFHPTLIKGDVSFCGLASEAIRGEGGSLVNQLGEPIMSKGHSLSDLAPRDIVARVMHEQISKGNSLFLDISCIHSFHTKFPQVVQLCELANIDWTKGSIPVLPGPHFHMGGVETDENGRTSLAQLYAVGEVACTGVHGANRLASNSLLESLVFGERTGEAILQASSEQPSHYPSSDESVISSFYKAFWEAPAKREIQKRVDQALGIVRNESALRSFIDWVHHVLPNNFSQTSAFMSKEQVEVAHMLLAAKLVAEAALRNDVSCGAHFREDIEGVIGS